MLFRSRARRTEYAHVFSGLLGETPETWAYSVRRALETRVPSITVYKLEVYANTDYYAELRRQKVSLPSDDEELAFAQHAIEELTRAGYQPVNFFTFTKNGGYVQRHITSKWQGGFWGQITITFPGAVPQTWHLRFGYPRGHIVGMNPDSRLAPNGHAALVRSTDYSSGSGPGGRTFAVGVGVQGLPTHPARCSFNGKACHIG